MNTWISFLVLSFAAIVSSSEDSLLVACEVEDIECLSRSTQTFLGKTCKGEYGFKAIDPLVIAGPLSYEVDKIVGLTFRFENLNVTGLRNQKISDFRMDLVAKSVLLKTKADLSIIGDITINLGDSKSFSGVYQATASVLGTARYNYDIIKNDKGVEYFVVGPETLTCEAIDEPTVSLNQELQDALTKDPHAAALHPAYTANQVNYRKGAICAITEVAYHDVVQNIRTAAKMLPKSAFFSNV